MNIDFVRRRITELRERKGVSEYKMSQDLGHSRGYIYNISSGKSLPPLKELFAIIEYFDITPLEFFREENHYPDLVNKVVEGVCGLDEKDIEVLLGVIGQMCLLRGIVKDLLQSGDDAKVPAEA